MDKDKGSLKYISTTTITMAIQYREVRKNYGVARDHNKCLFLEVPTYF